MIIYDEIKSRKLVKDRNISLEEIAEKIINQDVIEILKHKSRKSQKIFVMEIRDYIYAVPFITDEHDNIILKTAYPSRKLYEKYRRRK
jgi:uncharacterized DUF497 family protein